MDLDQPGLRLMLKLTGDVAVLDDSSMQALEKTRLKVKELLRLLQKTYSSEVDLDVVSVSAVFCNCKVVAGWVDYSCLVFRITFITHT